MRVFDEARYDARLRSVEDEAAPYVGRLGLADEAPEPFTPFIPVSRALSPAAEEGLTVIPDDRVSALRIVLLRRIAESDLGTAGSSHGVIRSRLMGRGTMTAEELELELALCRFAIDLGFGIALGWMRVSLLDPSLDDLERIAPGNVTDGLRKEAERLTELLANETLSMESDSTDRRFRLLLFLQRVEGGRLPAIAFDPGDPFGEAMRTIVSTDPDLAVALGPLLPIAAKATKVVPDRRLGSSLEALVHDESEVGPLHDGVARCIERLLLAPLSPRGPGFVTIRPSNQRIGRATLWAVPGLLSVEAATLLGNVGVRLGTSGKRDNQARDTAMANTCAALLGALEDDAAAASLVRMLARVRNKPVRKQVEKALAAAAERSGLTVHELVERSLPTFGLDATGSRSLPLDGWTAYIGLAEDGRVTMMWSGPGGEAPTGTPRELLERMPGEVADVTGLVDDIRVTLSDERHRLERLLAEEREWPIDAWRRRFIDHPVGRIHGRRLIWRVVGSGGARNGMPDSDRLIDAHDRPIAELGPDTRVRLWHPVEASAAEVDAWRDRLVERRIAQPFKQAFRETYGPIGGGDALQDLRFVDRPLAYHQMRALMGARGWTAPMLGPFDQGDRSVAYRELGGSGLRAELEHVPAGRVDPRERVEYARSGSVRFTTAAAEGRSRVLLRDVSPRFLSEVLRDVDLFTAVPDPMRSPTSSAEGEGSASLRTRADALRRLVPQLPQARALSVVGLWLRVESGGRAWAVSLADGSTLRLPEEQEVEETVEEGPGELDYLPFEDEVLSRALRTALALMARR